MLEENISKEFKLKNIEEIIKYVMQEIDQNELMSKKRKKVCRVLNYIENLLVLVLAFFGWYSYKNHKLCRRVKNLCNNWNILTIKQSYLIV